MGYLASSAAVLLAFWATIVLALARTAGAADRELGEADRRLRARTGDCGARTRS